MISVMPLEMNIINGFIIFTISINILCMHIISYYIILILTVQLQSKIKKKIVITVLSMINIIVGRDNIINPLNSKLFCWHRYYNKSFKFKD